MNIKKGLANMFGYIADVASDYGRRRRDFEQAKKLLQAKYEIEQPYKIRSDVLKQGDEMGEYMMWTDPNDPRRPALALALGVPIDTLPIIDPKTMPPTSWLRLKSPGGGGGGGFGGGGGIFGGNGLRSPTKSGGGINTESW